MAELTQPATVLSITDLTPHVRQLVPLAKTRKILFQPGQWVSLQLPVGIKPPLNRAYSIAEPPSPAGQLTLVFDRVPNGIGSSYLYGLKPGDELLLSGPYGNFLLPLSLDRELLLVSRYTGLVPIHCMLKHLAASGALPQSTLIAVGPAGDELLYHDELFALAAQHPSFRYTPVAVNGTDQEIVEAVLKLLRPLVPGRSIVMPLLSGVKGFVRPLRAYLMEAGYDRKEVKTETYD
ncbi:MAG: FAD-dependent oxidoreductase [Nitrospirota bacterium]|nr:FAD-dependent oxidoreductase [Nitrospirota bacterium]